MECVRFRARVRIETFSTSQLDRLDAFIAATLLHERDVVDGLDTLGTRGIGCSETDDGLEARLQRIPELLAGNDRGQEQAVSGIVDDVANLFLLQAIEAGIS